LSSNAQKTVVVIGNGMVGQRFCEKLVEFDSAKQYRIVTFCEEPRAAYDRVGLTSFFAHRDAEQLMLAKLEWYANQSIELHVGDRANQINKTWNTSSPMVRRSNALQSLAEACSGLKQPKQPLISVSKPMLSSSPHD